MIRAAPPFIVCQASHKGAFRGSIMGCNIGLWHSTAFAARRNLGHCRADSGQTAAPQFSISAYRAQFRLAEMSASKRASQAHKNRNYFICNKFGRYPINAHWKLGNASPTACCARRAALSFSASSKAVGFPNNVKSYVRRAKIVLELATPVTSSRFRYV